MQDKQKVGPEHTAVRVALWRALHVLLDSKPPILDDEIGLKLIADESWRQRPDMHPEGSKRVRASIVARARFIEDLVEQQLEKGVTQYVILGAGLDTFAQRRPEVASRLSLFEVDQPGPQAWKKQRLIDCGFTLPAYLKFVAVDFEAGESWWDQVIAAGFDPKKPAVVVSTGVTMYLTREANITTFQQMAKLAPGSSFATTFMYPLDLLEDADRASVETSMKFARMAGTPFISLFTPEDILALAHAAGFKTTQHVAPRDLTERYFKGRSDQLQPTSAEAILLGIT